jgi:hypothetical protein
MLIGRGLRTGVVLRFTTPEFVVDVDIALPGREVDILFGVISPERRPNDELFKNLIRIENNRSIKLLVFVISN